MLTGNFHVELLDVDVLEQLDIMVESTGQVEVKIDSYMKVVNTGKEESNRDVELLVMMVELATCMEVVGTGELVVVIHSCLEMVNNGFVVAECCSSMVVVKTCGSVLEFSILVEVEGSC